MRLGLVSDEHHDGPVHAGGVAQRLRLRRAVIVDVEAADETWSFGSGGWRLCAS